MVELGIEKERLLVKGEALASNDPRVGKLSLGLYRRGIRKVAIDSEIASGELMLLLDTLNMKPEEIAGAGGIAKLLRDKAIAHVAVEETAELTIVDGAEIPVYDDVISEIDGTEDTGSDLEEAGSPESFSRLFALGGGQDGVSARNLRKMLESPEIFTKILEKCALQLEKIEGDIDPETRVQQMLDMLQILGSAIASMPSEDERSEMLKSAAVSVLGLSANLKRDFVNRGIMPNLTLKGIEADILSRFPVRELADVLFENFKISGGAASVMESHLSSLNLNLSDKEELTEALHFSLLQGGELTPAVEAVLTGEPVETSFEDAEELGSRTSDSEPARMGFDVPHIEGYPPEKTLFQGTEKTDLIERVSEEFESDAASIIAPTLLDLLYHENMPIKHAELVKRITSYIDLFLSDRDYEGASNLVRGLQAELERKANVFSSGQLQPLEEALKRYAGEQGIRKLVADFKAMKRESPDFKRVTDYISALGPSATKALLCTLEDEESRHVRLLTCQALSHIGNTCVSIVAERIDHPTWYVARNAASILGQIGADECVPHLKKTLSHTEPRVRKEALKGLASIKSDEAIELICECVADADVEMQRAALGWIAAMRSPQTLSTLEGVLCEKAIWHKDDQVVRLAIEALGAIGTEPAAAILERLTRTRRLLFHRKKAALIRDTATTAFAKSKGRG